MIYCCSHQQKISHGKIRRPAKGVTEKRTQDIPKEMSTLQTRTAIYGKHYIH